MEHLFVPYELAVKLKDIGFDEPCFTSYTEEGFFIHPFDVKDFVNPEIKDLNDFFIKNSEINFEFISCPLWQQSFDWFILNFEISSWIETEYGWGKPTYIYKYNSESKGYNYERGYKAYEEARLKCLEKLIEIVKNK